MEVNAPLDPVVDPGALDGSADSNSSAASSTVEAVTRKGLQAGQWRTRQKFTQIDLDEAWRLRDSTKLSINSIAKSLKKPFNPIPLSTLKRLFDKGQRVIATLGRPPMFTQAAEEALCLMDGDVVTSAARARAKGRKKFSQAHATPVRNGSFKHEPKFSRSWHRGMIHRVQGSGKFVLQRVDPLDINRATALNPIAVDNLARRLKAIYKRLDITPDRIFNVDETGFDFRALPVVKFVKKGEKAVATARKSQVHVTVVAGGSASGQALTPGIIVGGAVGSEMLASAEKYEALIARQGRTGYVNAALFYQYCEEVLVPEIAATAEKPALLLLDGCVSHKCPAAQQLLRDHHILTVLLPAHTSHVLQPADNRPFQVFKAKAHAALSEVGVGDGVESCIPLVVDTIARVHHEAFFEPDAEGKVHFHWKAGFERTGLWPLDPRVIPEDAFAEVESLLARAGDHPDIAREMAIARHNLRSGIIPDTLPEFNLDHLLRSRGKKGAATEAEDACEAEAADEEDDSDDSSDEDDEESDAEAEPASDETEAASGGGGGGGGGGSDAEVSEEVVADSILPTNPDALGSGGAGAGGAAPAPLTSLASLVNADLHPLSEESAAKVHNAVALTARTSRLTNLFLNGTVALGILAAKEAKKQAKSTRTPRKRVQKESGGDGAAASPPPAQTATTGQRGRKRAQVDAPEESPSSASSSSSSSSSSSAQATPPTRNVRARTRDDDDESDEECRKERSRAAPTGAVRRSGRSRTVSSAGHESAVSLAMDDGDESEE